MHPPASRLLPLILPVMVGVVLTVLHPNKVEGWPLLEPGPQPSMADWDPAHTSDRKAISKMKTVSKAMYKPASSKLNNRCAEPPKRVLRQILGPAYIDTYMVEEDEVSQKKKRRTDEPSSRPFYLEEGFREVLSDRPAWEVSFDAPTLMISAESDVVPMNYRTSKGRRLPPEETEEKGSSHSGLSVTQEETDDDTEDEEHSRSKRGRAQIAGMLFHCEAPIRYRDLGEDYYPRFLREADCSKCQEEPRVRCQSRNFEVRVLRRQEECAPIDSNTAQDLTFLEEGTAGFDGMWRKWVLERLSVSFCCVCSRF